MANKKLQVESRAEANMKWQRHIFPRVKINSDASVKEGRGLGFGAVIRNSTGEFLVAKSSFSDSVHPSELAEAIAGRMGMELAFDMNCCQVILESDCLSLIQKLSSNSEDRSNLGLVVADIISLANNFDSFSFHYVPRNANKVAHILSQMSLSISCLKRT